MKKFVPQYFKLHNAIKNCTALKSKRKYEDKGTMNPFIIFLKNITPQNQHERAQENGNVIVFILIAVVLIGVVTAAIRSGGGESANIDSEQTAIRLSEVRQYASSLERGVAFIMQNGASEYDIRFAHADAPSHYGNINTTPDKQVFSRLGGGVAYQKPPMGIQTTPAPWAFYGGNSLPNVGSLRPDLVAVLPNVTKSFCEAANKTLGYAPTIIPVDPSPGCINLGTSNAFSNSDGIDDTADDYRPANDIPVGSGASAFITPATSGCVQCSDNSYHYFHTLMAR
jgi:hypothetical protein